MNGTALICPACGDELRPGEDAEEVDGRPFHVDCVEPHHAAEPSPWRRFGEPPHVTVH
jgi:hypothetical protein